MERIRHSVQYEDKPFTVVVLGLAEYGAFVRMPNGHKELLHISEATLHKVWRAVLCVVCCVCCDIPLTDM